MIIEMYSTNGLVPTLLLTSKVCTGFQIAPGSESAAIVFFHNQERWSRHSDCVQCGIAVKDPPSSHLKNHSCWCYWVRLTWKDGQRGCLENLVEHLNLEFSENALVTLPAMVGMMQVCQPHSLLWLKVISATGVSIFDRTDSSICDWLPHHHRYRTTCHSMDI